MVKRPRERISHSKSSDSQLLHRFHFPYGACAHACPLDHGESSRLPDTLPFPLTRALFALLVAQAMAPDGGSASMQMSLLAHQRLFTFHAEAAIAAGGSELHEFVDVMRQQLAQLSACLQVPCSPHRASVLAVRAAHGAAHVHTCRLPLLPS